MMGLKTSTRISACIFTIVWVSGAGARPGNKYKPGKSVRNLEESDCLYTYTAVQPNLDFVKEKVAEFTVDKCDMERWKQEVKEKKKKHRKLIRMQKRRKQLRRRKMQKPRIKTKTIRRKRKGRKCNVKETRRKIQQRKHKNFNQQFRNWKRKVKDERFW